MPGTIDTAKLDRLICEKHGSHAAFVKVSGMSKQYLSAVVNGKIDPSLERAVQFAALLDCAVDDLIMRPDRPDPEK